MWSTFVLIDTFSKDTKLIFLKKMSLQLRRLVHGACKVPTVYAPRTKRRKCKATLGVLRSNNIHNSDYVKFSPLYLSVLFLSTKVRHIINQVFLRKVYFILKFLQTRAEILRPCKVQECKRNQKDQPYSKIVKFPRCEKEKQIWIDALPTPARRQFPQRKQLCIYASYFACELKVFLGGFRPSQPPSIFPGVLKSSFRSSTQPHTIRTALDLPSEFETHFLNQDIIDQR